MARSHWQPGVCAQVSSLQAFLRQMQSVCSLPVTRCRRCARAADVTFEHVTNPCLQIVVAVGSGSLLPCLTQIGCRLPTQAISGYVRDVSALISCSLEAIELQSPIYVAMLDCKAIPCERDRRR